MVVSAQGESVELTVPGFASLLVPGLPPSAAFFAPNLPILGDLFASLTPAGPPDGGPQALLDDTSGDGGTSAIGGLDGAIDGLLGPLDLGRPLGPDPSIQTEAAIAALGEEGVLDGNTLFADLFTLSGTAQYSFNGAFTQFSPAVVGIFNAVVTLDFTNREICPSSCFISVSAGSISDSTGVIGAPFNYSGAVGVANSILFDPEISNPFFNGTEVGLINSNGIIANQAEIDIIYNDGSFSGTSGTDPNLVETVLSDPR